MKTTRKKAQPENETATPPAPTRSRRASKPKSAVGDEAGAADPSLLSIVRVETTVRSTYDREAGQRKRPVIFKPDREIDSDETWMFTDGSSTGWYGLVVLRRGEDPRLAARRIDMEMKNVGAEVNALLMALEAIVPGERVAVVADFLWSIYYVLGWWNAKHPALIEQVAAARALLDARRPASLRFIHVQGHQNDGSAFGRWNKVADQLCSLRRPVDCAVPISAFGEASAPARSVAKILGDAPTQNAR
jgi:hypothetical protein